MGMRVVCGGATVFLYVLLYFALGHKPGASQSGPCPCAILYYNTAAPLIPLLSHYAELKYASTRPHDACGIIGHRKGKGAGLAQNGRNQTGGGKLEFLVRAFKPPTAPSTAPVQVQVAAAFLGAPGPGGPGPGHALVLVLGYFLHASITTSVVSA